MTIPNTLIKPGTVLFISWSLVQFGNCNSKEDLTDLEFCLGDVLCIGVVSCGGGYQSTYLRGLDLVFRCL